MRLVPSLLLAAAALFASERAAAQESTGFGEQYPFVLSLEHLGGVVAQRIDPDNSGASTVVSAGLFNTFVYSGPLQRLGVHYFVAPPLSVGALLHYSDNDIYGENLLLGARVGVAFPFSSSTALWVRGGIAYTSTKLESLGKITIRDVRPGAEVLLVLSPVDHFAVLLGGSFEIGVAGKRESESSSGQTTSEDFKYMEYGLTFGVLADF